MSKEEKRISYVAQAQLIGCLIVVGICGPVATIIAVDWIEKKIGKRVISPVFGG